MNRITKILQSLYAGLSLLYINNFLRHKGIATNEYSKEYLSFKLYDMNWDLSYEKGRFGLRVTFDLGDDFDKLCMLQSVNKLNNDRWIVKAFIDKRIVKDNNEKEYCKTSIIFSFESFCYSKSEFKKLYEFAIYAMADGLEFHRKCYRELLEEKNKIQSNPSIGFHSEQNKKDGVDNSNRPTIGFYH